MRLTSAKAILVGLSVASLVMLGGCSGQSKPPGEKPLPVETADVTIRDVPILIEATGNVYSLRTVNVRPQVGGLITKVHVAQGDMVKRGQILYTIDPRPYQAAVDEAKATLAKDMASLKLAEATVKRYEDLVKQDYVAQLTFDKYKTDVELGHAQVLIDQALLDIAKINLGYTTIRSPMDGRISEYHIDVGNVVVANDQNALTQILQVAPADIHFAITQGQFVAVRQAQQRGSFKLYAYLPEYPDEPREGEIYFYDNHIDTDTGTILFKGAIANEDLFFWPGEFVRVRLQLRVDKDATLVPIPSVQVGQKGKFVYVYKPEDNTVEYRTVETGDTLGTLMHITKGLQKGERVVTNGQINLRPGAKVFLVGQKDNP